ncbi:MAG: Csu type fimbrial protein [Casimicrobiaceae bacterium]
MKRCIEAVAGVTLLVLAGPILGATCTISSSPKLSFPNYDVFIAAPTTSSQIAKFRCDVASTTITIGIGTSATSGSISNRQMAQTPGTGRLNYNLYKDGGYSSLWGDGTAGTSALVVNTTAKTTSVPIYGKIDPGQDAPVGKYKDTVIVSVNP